MDGGGAQKKLQGLLTATVTAAAVYIPGIPDDIVLQFQLTAELDNLLVSC